MSDGTVLVAIGASAGGVQALRELMSRLPGDVQAAVLIVLHVPSAGESLLPEILDRVGPLHVERADNAMEITPGRVVVAPPDYHMTVTETHVLLDRGPRVNGHRPAIDPLFSSAANWYGPHAMGVLLSGMLDDGAAGLLRLSQVGAVTVAQAPNEAAYPALPRAGIERGGAQKVLVLDDIANLIAASSDSRAMTLREVVAMQGREDEATERQLSPFTCPSCHGTLWEITDPASTQFRCRTGHTFSVDSLVQASTEALDDALWAGHRALLEQADLCRRMSCRIESVENTATADRYDTLARDAERRAWVLHEGLVVHEDTSKVNAEGG
jgi:two-component system, chemotaxis family, protein-glutamate methylesterase/glutaminase